jgi:hypothetical protein
VGHLRKSKFGGLLDEFRCALGAGKRCVLRDTLEGGYRAYYHLDPIKGRAANLREPNRFQKFWGWDISPDGTQVPIPNRDSRQVHIRVVALDPGPNDLHET